MWICVAPFKCRVLSHRQFSLKEWLMPVYFRKAKPFPQMGGGDSRKGKRTRRKEEMKRDETDVWMGACEMLQCCICNASLASEPGWATDNQKLYIVSKGHTGTSLDLSHGIHWKESKYSSSRLNSMFIKQWITDILCNCLVDIVVLLSCWTATNLGCYLSVPLDWP